ncbi:MAG: SDR family oxidoreductase [Gammaproteobacteria bacterium]|nr:SDR family oxidoreductase [Gammaproteobacteria bacterium]
MEQADREIRVNAVSPAVVETPIFGGFIAPDEIQETLQGFDTFHPIGRKGQSPDVAAVVGFLLSEQADLVAGAEWDVDGGVMAVRDQARTSRTPPGSKAVVSSLTSAPIFSVE